MGACSALILGACGNGGDDNAGAENNGDPMTTVTETMVPADNDSAAGDDAGGGGEDSGNIAPGEPAPGDNAGDGSGGSGDNGDDSTAPGEVTVPGEQVETYFSNEGAMVGIAGLDSANAPEIIRTQPSFDAEQVSEVWRTGSVELAGREWNNTTLPDEGYWAEVRLDGIQGWMPSANLFYFGGVEDVTGEYADIEPVQDPYQALGTIGERSANGMGRWAVVTTPDDTGDGAYRLDVTGMQDDAQAGERLRVSFDEDHGLFRVAQVERTLLCARGVTEGMCV